MANVDISLIYVSVNLYATVTIGAAVDFLWCLSFLRRTAFSVANSLHEGTDGRAHTVHMQCVQSKVELESKAAKKLENGLSWLLRRLQMKMAVRGSAAPQTGRLNDSAPKA